MGWLYVCGWEIFSVLAAIFGDFSDSIRISTHFEFKFIRFPPIPGSPGQSSLIHECRELKFIWTQSLWKHTTSVPTTPAMEFIDMHTASISVVRYRTVSNLEKLPRNSSFY